MSISLLVVEDEPLIAIDVEYTLRDANFSDVTVLASRAEAWSYLARNTPALAIVDLKLKDGLSTDVCRELKSRGVPLIISSGSLDAHQDEFFQGILFLPKPSGPHALLALVIEALKAKNLRYNDDRGSETEAYQR